MQEVIIQQICCPDTACGNWKILLVLATFQLDSVLYRTEEPRASLSAVRVLAEERHHYLHGTMERIIFYLKNKLLTVVGTVINIHVFS